MGLLRLSKEPENYHIFIPDTPFTNAYHAVTVMKTGVLAATSPLGALLWDGQTHQNYIQNYC